MISKKVGRTFLISSLLLIIAVLGFTGGLNIGSFQNNYTNSLISSYAVSGEEVVRKVEYAVKYGKPLENFYGIEELLQEKLDDSPDLIELQIVLNDGTVMYNQEGGLENLSLTKEQLEKVSFTGEYENSSYLYDVYDGAYHVYVPINDREQQWLGSLCLIFSEDVIKDKTNIYLVKLLSYLGIIAIVVFLALFIIFSKVSIFSDSKTINKKALFTALLSVLGVVQITFGILNYNMFKTAYVDILMENTSFASKVISKDIDSVIEKGVTYNQLYKLEDYLIEIVESVNEIDAITMIDESGNLLYSSLLDNQIDNTVEDSFKYSVDLYEDLNGVKSMLSVTLSQNYIDSQLKSIILDTVTIIVISFLLTVEFTLFLLIFLKRQIAKGNQKDSKDTLELKEVYEDRSIVRTLAFIVFFSIFLTTSFIPIVMKSLYVPIPGLSKDVVIGLPLTMEMLCAGIFTVVAGFLIDKKGWRPVFYIGISILVLGTLLSGLASNGIMFILARAVSGTGYGMALMAMRGFVNCTASEEKRTVGFTAHVSGLFAGINCGVIIGAMLADRIGFSSVFFVAIGIMLIAVMFATVFMENSLPDEGVTRDAVRKTYTASTLRAFFVNRKVLIFFIFVLIPTSAMSMFLDYYFPVFAESIGASTSDVGRAFLINGLVVVYLGPVLSKYCLKYLGIEKSIFTACLIITTGFIVFAFTGTLWAGFLTALLLGVAESFGMTAQNNYFAKLPAAQDIGPGKAFGFYGNVKKLGQMSGPIIFGTSAMFGILGIGFIGIALIVFILLFLLTQRRPKIDVSQQTGVDM